MENTPQPIKFDEAELAEVAAIRDSYSQITMVYGNITLQKKQLESAEKKQDAEHAALQTREREFLDKIVARYGEGQLDPQSGIFTPAPKKV